MKTIRKTIVALMLLLSIGAFGQQIDSSFGVNGHIFIDFAQSYDSLTQIVLQPDGKIVAVGLATVGARTDLALARVNTDGTLDNTFGTGGKVTTDVGNNTQANDVALQTDGKIVVAGYAATAMGWNFVTARYQTNGWLDSTFGVNGIVIDSNINYATNMLYSVAIQSDGKILVGGSNSSNSSANIALKRYMTDGTTDQTFNIPNLNSNYYPAYRMHLMPDGKIVVASLKAVLRFNEDGSADNTFGTNGIASATPLVYTNIQLNNDQSIIGSTSYFSGYESFEMDSLGGMVNTYGSDGISDTVDPGLESYCNALAIQKDNKVVAAGSTISSSPGNYSAIGIVRFDANGLHDAAFGTNGFFAVSETSIQASGGSIVVQADSDIVIGGTGTFVDSLGACQSCGIEASNFNFLIYRLSTAPMSPPAGPNRTICQGATAYMFATGTGNWAPLASNPTATTISNPAYPLTTITGFSAVGTYGYTWDPGDTAYVFVNALPPTPTLTQYGTCIGADTLEVSPSYLASQITWYLAGSPAYTSYIVGLTIDSTYMPTATGVYTATITGANGCASLISDTVSVTGCPPDTAVVWPGDADANHVVDNTDLLPIGLGYDSTGPVRTVQGIVWQADTAADWPQSFSIYAPLVNFKNADCNGDGIINADDTLAIMANFGLIHQASSSPQIWRSGTPAIYLSMTPDTAANGDTVTTTVLLGDPAMPVNNIYGLAFTLHFDPLVIDPGTGTFGFSSSWLGSGANSISIHKDYWSNGMIKAAITGIDHTARSGNGQIATLIGVITTGNINGKDMDYYLNRTYITDVTAIDQLGNPVSLNEGADSNYIAFLPDGIRETDAAPSVRIYPNPASDQVIVSCGSAMTSIVITDVLGNIVQTIPADEHLSESIDLSHIADGVYVIQVNTSKGAATGKLVVTK